jgi:Uma2 family endonuclease
VQEGRTYPGYFHYAAFVAESGEGEKQGGEVMSVRNRKLLDEIEEFDYPEAEIDYPESDGKPMAETDKHRDLMTALIGSLSNHFAGEADVYVSGNLLLYYVEGDRDKCVAPDVFVVRGVGKHERRTYKLWEERHAPNVVIEISSRGTKKEDLNWKKQLYAWLGVREYFIFDPEYKLKPAAIAAIGIRSARSRRSLQPGCFAGTARKGRCARKPAGNPPNAGSD